MSTNNYDSDDDSLDASTQQLIDELSTGDKKTDIYRVSQFSSREKLIYGSIKQYFKDTPKNIRVMRDIIDGKGTISLRILDWFVTRYAKKHKVSYALPDCEDDDKFVVHISYKAQLKTFTKMYFDPFRRKIKFVFTYGTEKSFLTTIGQLNFFQWAISNDIIDYVEKHYDTIVKEMNTATKESKDKKTKKTKAEKRLTKEDIKITARQSISNEHVNIVLTFD